ncbi:MAG: ATP-dependent 6-phosphofructokinase [Elusimicrobia bacterium]|nr:ATP-dependent 6-phosphofructokinase [Elusimicrobiota bacterium]
MRARGRLGILTGGGDCPGLNPAVRGCVLKAAQAGFEPWGILDGWKGLMEGRGRPLTREEVEPIVGWGGTILGTSRTNPFQVEEGRGVESCLRHWKAWNLSAAVVMGGEDTLGVAARLYQERSLPVIGVPKTMDNDLSATDYTFGFDSSVTVAVDAAERLRDTGASHHRVMILEVMGRHAGWVALFTGIASGADVTLIPERPVPWLDLARQIRKVHARRSTVLMVASESISLEGIPSRDQDGSQKKDAFGHSLLKERGVGEILARWIQQETGLEARASVIGHIQRGGPPTLFDRILATRVGVAAAELAEGSQFGKMVALEGSRIVAVSLQEATAKLKLVPPDWWSLLNSVSAPELGSGEREPHGRAQEV